MSKLQLPSVTIIIVDCLNVERAIRVLERCKELCDFGAVKLLTSLPTNYEHKVEIMPLNSLIAYSIFCLTKLNDYFDTSHLLTVQADGWILNPQCFKQEWLQLDWISPLFVQFTQVGSGGFSLRSKRLMSAVTDFMPTWDGTDEHAHELQKSVGYYEDGFICLSRQFKHFNFAPLEDAADFGQGGCRDVNYFRATSFGFHRNWADIDFTTMKIDNTTVGNSLKNSYVAELEALTPNVIIC